MHHPLSFIGNEKTIVSLSRDLETEALAHAYLFAGPSDLGKFRAAKAFAEDILTRGLTDDELHRVRHHIHSLNYEYLTVCDQLWMEDVCDDWEVIARSSNFNQEHRAHAPKAKSDTIGIRDLSEIIARIHTSHDETRIILIRRIERMTTEAANSLLKTLEEPPPRTIFLLTTDHLSDLLPTIVSRCRVERFDLVPTETIEAALAERFPATSVEDRKRIATFALGRPGRAFRLAADPELLTHYGDYFRRLKQLFEKPDTLLRLRFAEEVTKSAADTDFFLEALTYFLRSFLLTRARKPDATSRYSTDKLLDLLRQTDETRRLIAGNVNARLAVETLLLAV